MASSDELTRHANSDIRCERREPQPEGIGEAKLELISRRGVSWEYIYEVLFPGAPIPSPCE